jgi:hypothetical protein
MERGRFTGKVLRGLRLAFALVTPSTITATNDLGAAQSFLEKMQQWYDTPNPRRGRPAQKGKLMGVRRGRARKRQKGIRSRST